MSMLNSIELIIEGEILELSNVLDKIYIFIGKHDNLMDMLNVKEIKEDILKIKIAKTTRVFLDFVVNDRKLLDLIIKLSFKHPNIIFWIRNENDLSLTEKKYKNGILIENVEFNSLVNWRLYTENMYLCSNDIREFIETNLDYLIDETDSFDDFEYAVLNEFKDVEFTKNYTMDDLKIDILNTYKYLTE